MLSAALRRLHLQGILPTGALLILSACGGGGSAAGFGPEAASLALVASSSQSEPAQPESPAVHQPVPGKKPASHAVGGTIVDLKSDGLVLQNMGGDDLKIPPEATSFSFSTPVAEHGAFSVSIRSQPAGWKQACRVDSPAGVIEDHDVTTVRVICTEAHTKTTFLAGGAEQPGSSNGVGTQASFDTPQGIAIDSKGNLYVVDQGNAMIRKVTPQGEVSTVAGSLTRGHSNGVGVAATFNDPRAIAIDRHDNLYVADDNSVRKITPQNEVTTLAGSSDGDWKDAAGTDARFWNVYGIAVDGNDDIYVVDQGNAAIRKITPNGVVTTMTGRLSTGTSIDGPVEQATFVKPEWIAIGPSGTLYVTEEDRIRKISNGSVSTVTAPDGSTLSIYASAIAAGRDGTVYVAQAWSPPSDLRIKILELSPTGAISTLNDFAGGPVRPTLYYPFCASLAIDARDALYVGICKNGSIQKLEPVASPSSPS
ncbi:hypothetical protein ABL849_33145 (plasmid) [Variovorax sp. 375MFSha3.1]|uniref:hypothetical protein n=1 Tax=unclassified Variovorax TaxID=663243 RepID=UPI003AACAEA6